MVNVSFLFPAIASQVTPTTALSRWLGKWHVY